MQINHTRPPMRTMGSTAVKGNNANSQGAASNSASQVRQNNTVEQQQILAKMQLQAQPYLGSNINLKG